MPDDPPVNSLAPPGQSRRSDPGDVPERLRRRYFVDGRGGDGLGFYVDAKVERPAFKDHGHKLIAARSDPNVIRDLAAIAQHRGWTIVVVRGEASFRREAWVEGRAIGLEVRGYRPTERDLQEAARRGEGRAAKQPDKDGERTPEKDAPADRSVRNARNSMKVVEAVVRARIAEPAAQEALLKVARSRIASWLERGATFRPLDLGRPEPKQTRNPERARLR